MRQFETLNVPPDIARICEGLRDTGYDLNMAVADIIDNSITAGATLIDVRASMDEQGNVALSVADNGCGMDKDALINAMRYGSAQHDEPGSLGKFGLGLKTASTAFCRKLAVCSRPFGQTPALTAVWDLDVLSRTQSWALALGPAGELEMALLEACAPGAAGTVVIWDQVDRIMNRFSGSSGENAQSVLDRMLAALRDHLAAVFQRFLDPADSRARNITLRLNGQDLRPWDPFCVDVLQGSEELCYLNATINGENIPIVVEAFLLPREEELPETARRNARLKTENQGIYVYRENRLIHGPNWLGLFPQEPQFSLLRISLSFDSRLDEAFMVDIKKSRILINEQLYAWLKDEFLPRHRASAEERYRKGAARQAVTDPLSLHRTAAAVIERHLPGLCVPGVAKAGKRDVTLVNALGKTSLRPLILENGESGHIALIPGNADEALWQPAIINHQTGVALNTGHAFYQKIYLTHGEDSPLLQALDYLFWSLAQAEWNQITPKNKAQLPQQREEAGRNLGTLLSDLPES